MTRRAAPPQPQPPILSTAQKRRCVERLQNCIRDLQAFDPQKVQKRGNIPEVMALEAGIKDALSAALGDGTPAYNRYYPAADLDQGSWESRGNPMFGGASDAYYDARDADDARRYLAEGKERSVALLQQAIRTLEAEIADQDGEGYAVSTAAFGSTSRDRKVFIVHGHDEGMREAVARFLAALGFEAIILHEQANQGRTVIEKVEAHGSVGFAVVLLTPDDVGKAKDAADLNPRARQNVLLELGYFIGRLGRSNVCALKRGEIEIPSDFGGVVYEPFDASGGWKQVLGRELEAAKFEIDWNKVMRS